MNADYLERCDTAWELSRLEAENESLREQVRGYRATISRMRACLLLFLNGWKTSEFGDLQKTTEKLIAETGGV